MAIPRPTTILYLEDDPAVRLQLGDALRAEGFAVQEAATGAEGLRLAEARPDVVLLDLRLPDMSGIEVCRRIKAASHTAATLVLYHSAHPAPSNGQASHLAGGADGFLGKPSEPRAVVAQINALLRLRRAEGVARGAAQQWRTTFDAVRDGIVLVDRAGIVLRCNRALADLLHRSFLDIVGYPYEELLRAAGAVPLPAVLRVHETCVRETAELAIGERWFRVSADPVADEHGDILGSVHLFADVTEEKHSRQALAQLAAIVTSSDEAMIGTTLDGLVLSWNPAAQRLFGYATDEVTGQSLARLIRADRAAELMNDLAVVRLGQRRDYYETQWQCRGGALRDVAVTVSPIREAGGTVLGASVIVRDITAHKRLEEQFRQAQKMEAIGRLAGGVAHDLNNLLTIILGYGHVIAGRLPAADALQGPAAEILKAGDRATVLTRQLLAFSRQQVLRPRVISLNAVVAELEKMLARVIGEDITLTVRLDPALQHVSADPVQMDQVLLNLAVNARDAMPDGGRLLVETANVTVDEAGARANPDLRPGPYVLLAVHDTGTGIAHDLLPHIFEPFFTTKEVGKGTGLGLSTVYGIVKQSGGHISVATELGKGTTFKIYLPATAEPVSSLPAAAPAATELSGQETILVVEDEEGVRNYTAFALRCHRYHVLTAASGDEARCLARRHPGPIHLLLTDVIMPGMNARELVECLAESHQETRVLYISGYTSDSITRLGFRGTEKHFLQKPFRPEELARKVREVLDQPVGQVCNPPNERQVAYLPHALGSTASAVVGSRPVPPRR
jgi:PAS domain S-box-containing protein